MIKKSTILIWLLIAVVALFVLKPDLLGSGEGTTLLVAPTTEMAEIPTDIECSTVQDCIDFAAEQGDTTDVQATCDNTCTYLIEHITAGGVE